MLGPEIGWYLVLAGMLFVTGALGVLVRRSPLIILLSVEIMLNGANLALIAFSRQFAQEDGQVFAIAVMAIAASEVVVGLGLSVAMGRPHIHPELEQLGPPRRRPRRRQDEHAARMNGAAWPCLLLPLAAAPAITLAGGRITRRQAGYLSTTSTIGAFVAAIVAFVISLGESPEQRTEHYST